jgi:NitT/TauT family transport system substrate-binding protein
MSCECNLPFSSLVSLLQARDKGLPVKIIVAGSSSTATTGTDVTMINVGPNRGIKSAKDPEGKIVSVNALNGLLQLLRKIAAKANGGDPSKVRFIKLGMADAPAALQSGKINAKVGAEPFGTAAIAAGFPGDQLGKSSSHQPTSPSRTSSRITPNCSTSGPQPSRDATSRDSSSRV